MSGKAPLDHFSALDDPRQSWKVIDPLPEIMLLVPWATLSIPENARSTPSGRERRVRLAMSGLTPQGVAETMGVYLKTVRKWVARFQAEGGLAGPLVAAPTPCIALSRA